LFLFNNNEYVNIPNKPPITGSEKNRNVKKVGLIKAFISAAAPVLMEQL
jgi:hypothetical protein